MSLSNQEVAALTAIGDRLAESDPGLAAELRSMQPLRRPRRPRADWLAEDASEWDGPKIRPGVMGLLILSGVVALMGLLMMLPDPEGAPARPPAATGTAQTGTASTGTASTGTAPTGTAPTGTAPTGTAPTGTAPTGTAPTGADENAGRAAPGDDRSRTDTGDRANARISSAGP